MVAVLCTAVHYVSILALRMLIFALKKARASGRNVGKVFNPVLKLVFENYPFSALFCCTDQPALFC